jgi:hypothetical protein
MDESNARKEAVKRVAEGFSVYLVIVCVEGNGTLQDKVFEDKAEFPGVTVILLSKASVQNFLGESLVETFSSATALVDSGVRVGVSPMKGGSSLKDIVKNIIEVPQSKSSSVLRPVVTNVVKVIIPIFVT